MTLGCSIIFTIHNLPFSNGWTVMFTESDHTMELLANATNQKLNENKTTQIFGRVPLTTHRHSYPLDKKNNLVSLSQLK